MASDSTTDTGARAKVTLTNWERLNNSPLLLPQASAVQWNEYVFVLAKDGTALLYHTKYGMWSVLPECPCQLNNSMAAVNYKGQVIVATTSRSQQLLAFDILSSKWKERPDLAIEDRSRSISLAVDNDKLYACIVIIEAYSNFRAPKQTSLKLLGLSESGWKLEEELKYPNYLTYVKLALLSKHYIIQTSPGELYLRPRKPAEQENENEEKKENEEKIKDEKIPETIPPPYTDSTLHVVKDTVFAFGGRDEDNQPTSDVLRYNPDTDSWESAGYMRTTRYNVAVVTVTHDSTQYVYCLGGSFGSTRLEMKPKIKSDKASDITEHWECSTCMTERCTVE